MNEVTNGWLPETYSGSQLIILYFALLSFAGFILFAWDKWKARRGAWRTPESTLLGLSLLGAWPGAGIAMVLFRHKISKQSFMLRYYLTIAGNILAIAAVIWARLNLT